MFAMNKDIVEIQQRFGDKIVPNEKEIMFNFIRKQKNCEFSLRFFLQKENDLWKNVFAMFRARVYFCYALEMRKSYSRI